jgi:plastocyanin
VTAGTRDNPTDLFSSGDIAVGESFTFMFEEAGTYEYFCALHPGMAGTIVVQ